MTSLFWGSSNSKFDEDVDRATAETLPSGGENLELNFEISDSIRSKTVVSKDAMRSIKRRINHKNPNVQLFALSVNMYSTTQLADTCVKNGGNHFLVEIASREFLDNLVSIIKQPTVNSEVKQKILRLMQNWAIGFESKPSLSYAEEIYKVLQKEGFNFPPKDSATTSAAMIDTLTPPEWVDSDVCLRCRSPFSFTNRKHHCRSCGLVFDQQCSSKVLSLPSLGIMQPVRVCDGCFVKVNKSKTAPLNGDTKTHYRSSSVKSTTSASASHKSHKSARDLADEELQRAIQLSLEESGMVHGPRRTGYVPQTPVYETSEPPLVETVHGGLVDDEDDLELRAAIEASLREANAPKPSAPLVQGESYEPEQKYVAPIATVPPLPIYDLDDHESDAIMTFSQTVETAQSRGAHDFVRHHEVNDLYERTNSVRPKLVRSLDDAERREQMLSEMNQKLSQAARLYDQLLTAQVSSPARQQTNAPTEQYQYSPSSPYYAPIASATAPSQLGYEYQPTVPEGYQSFTGSSSQSTHEHQPVYYPTRTETVSRAQCQPLLPAAATSPEPPYHQHLPPVSIQDVYQPPVILAASPPTVQAPITAVTSPPLQHPQSYAPSHAQPQLFSPPPIALPNFPTVPSAPLPLPQQRVLSPQVEPQKEAMLISFD